MAVDLKQFRGAFFEEAGEHLAEMERLLLALDPASPDAEGVNAIFRAAHSIKGGANMFALADIAGVTHEMETVLEAARKGKLPLTGAIVDALLRGCDYVRHAVAQARAGQPADAARAVALNAELRGLAAPQAAPSHARLEIAWPAKTRRDAKKTKKLIADLSRLVPLLPAQMGELEAALADHGKAALALPEGSDAGRIRDSLAFVLPEECIRIVAPERAEFGFFEENLPKARPAAVPAAPQPARSAGVDQVSIRVNAEKIDRLINLTGELMIGYSMIRSGVGSAGSSDHLGMALATVERNIRELQEAALSIRMIPIAGVFARFPRLVHDLSAQLGKRAELRVEGESTELDRGLVEKLIDPLAHLIRNSLDHGIEPPQAREAAGKPARGTVWLSASHESGSVVIEVSDDGAGLSRERILKRAAEQGLRADESLSDLAVWELIFAPGFSTASEVSDVSGRGVGMDVVRRNVRELGGHVDIASEPGKGTRTVVRLPLTLAIMDGMELAVGGEVYIAPLSAIVESLRPAPQDLKRIGNDSQVLNLRGEILPVLSLAKALGIEHACKPGEEVLVVVESGGRRAALAADTLLGQQQIVVKNMEGNFGKVSGVAGATILGNGAVSLILDIPELMRA
ncbi:MAG TPA: chemotaxis protein CheA, partial [Burkholderiales bacterium]|nr:chemotaxis protein CheA [Burkholderiales bacterium]